MNKRELHGILTEHARRINTPASYDTDTAVRDAVMFLLKSALDAAEPSPASDVEDAPRESVRRCNCGQGELCPLGRTGSMTRCTADELRNEALALKGQVSNLRADNANKHVELQTLRMQVVALRNPDPAPITALGGSLRTIADLRPGLNLGAGERQALMDAAAVIDRRALELKLMAMPGNDLIRQVIEAARANVKNERENRYSDSATLDVNHVELLCNVAQDVLYRSVKGEADRQERTDGQS